MPPLKKQSRCTRSRADSVQPAPFLRSADGRSPNWRLIATDNVLALSLQPVVQNLSIWRGNTYDRAHHHLKKNARQFSFMGDRRRTGDIRGVLRLELRLVAGGHDGVYGRRPRGRRHVLRLYFQLYRADHRHPARWRPFRLCLPRLRAHRRLYRRFCHSD